MAAEKRIQPSESYVNQNKKVDFSLVNTLLNLIKNDRNELIVRIISEIGCTSKELVNIKHSDISFKENTIQIGSNDSKKGAKRILSISNKLSDLLKKFSNPNKKFIFHSKKSPQLRTRSIRKIFDKYSKELGTKITSNSIRKAYIINSIKDDKSTDKIKTRIGIKRFDNKEFINFQEFQNLKKHTKNNRDKIILSILFETGCNVNELVQLNVGDIEFTTNSLILGAVEQKRTITISKKLSLQLKSFVIKQKLTMQDYLLATRQSSTISEKRIFQIVKRITREAGLNKASPKILRYSHIVQSIAAGKSIEEISKNTGIKNLSKIHLYGSLIAKGGYSYNND
jgi:site-specific recombinase XerD